LTHTIFALKDKIYLLLLKCLKMFVGFVKDGMSSNLDLLSQMIIKMTKN